MATKFRNDHKYISKKWVNGKWKYYYDDGKGGNKDIIIKKHERNGWGDSAIGAGKVVSVGEGYGTKLKGALNKAKDKTGLFDKQYELPVGLGGKNVEFTKKGSISRSIDKGKKKLNQLFGKNKNKETVTYRKNKDGSTTTVRTKKGKFGISTRYEQTHYPGTMIFKDNGGNRRTKWIKRK